MFDDSGRNKNFLPSMSQVMAMQQFPFVTILLSEQCNARCPHCINTLQRDQKTHMDEKKLKILIDDLLADNFGNLKLLGGEPTVHPNFQSLYPYFQSKFKRVTLFTNALNGKVKEVTPRALDYVTYNGYFIDDSFDTAKFLPRNPVPFLRTIQNVINTSFDFESFKKRAVIVRDFFRGVGLEKYYTMALSLDCTEDIFLNAGKLNKILVDLVKFLSQNRINYTTHRNAPACFFVDQELINLKKTHPIFPHQLCDVSYGQAIIDTDFNLKYCDRMPRILGNVFRNDYETIDFEEFKIMMYQGYLWKLEDNYRHKCKGCKWWLKHCNGGCYANNNSKVFDDNIRLEAQCNTGE